jgi:hypothetical protein
MNTNIPLRKNIREIVRKWKALPGPERSDTNVLIEMLNAGLYRFASSGDDF